MKKLVLILTLLVCTYSITNAKQMPPKAPTLHQFCQSLGKGTYSGTEGIPNVLVMRGCAWLKAGIIDKVSELELVEAAKKGNGKPGSPIWIKEFTKLGDKYMAIGEKAEKIKDKKVAHKTFETSAHFYYMARWPHLFSKEAEIAYKRHVIAYRKASKYLNPPIQELKIPYEGKTIIAHLRMPKSDKPLPLIVFSPGIDDWKGEMNDFINPMLKAGFATLVIDLPGTGESEFKLEAGSHKVFMRVIEYAKKLSGIDKDKIGFYGLSGGGYFAVAMALTEPSVKASVNIGGPVDLSFSKKWLNTTPQSILATITRCAGFNIKKEGKQEVIEQMLPISLKEQGLLKPIKNPPQLLTINGEKDILAHPGEYRLIDELGIKQDMLIFENDGHVAPAHFDIHIPFSIMWLKKSLKIKN